MKNASLRNKRVSSTRQRKQQHLLEVTVRRDKARAMQLRKGFALAFKIVLTVGLIAGAYVGSKEGLRRFVWENPDYYLSDLRIPTEGALTREQIHAATGIMEGRNIFLIDLAAAREGLDKLPQVDRAEIQRVLPNRIDVSITERRPIAWVTSKVDEDPTTSDRSLLIDARGVVMRSKVMLPEYLNLPIITTPAVENFAPGQRVQSFEIVAALELVRLNADSTSFQVRNIDASKGYCLVVTDRTRAKITFGLDHIDQQLDRLHRLIERIQPTQREIQTVNLFVEKNVPVTFVDQYPGDSETVPEPVAAKPEAAKDKFLATRDKPAPSKSPSAARKPEASPKSKKDDSSSSRKSPGSVKKPFRP